MFGRNLSKWIKSHDSFGQPLPIMYDGEKELRTSCGGFFSLVIKITFLTLLVLELYEIVSYNHIDIAQTNIFYDVSELEFNVTHFMSNFTFGFKYKGNPIDMVENEYVRVHFTYE